MNIFKFTQGQPVSHGSHGPGPLGHGDRSNPAADSGGPRRGTEEQLWPDDVGEVQCRGGGLGAQAGPSQCRGGGLKLGPGAGAAGRGSMPGRRAQSRCRGSVQGRRARCWAQCWGGGLKLGAGAAGRGSMPGRRAQSRCRGCGPQFNAGAAGSGSVPGLRAAVQCRGGGLSAAVQYRGGGLGAGLSAGAAGSEVLPCRPGREKFLFSELVQAKSSARPSNFNLR